MGKNFRLIYLAIAIWLAAGACLPAYSQYFLRVTDPQQAWRTQQGTIDEAVFTLAPKGAFTEVGMYLTFSARGSEGYFANGLPLEVRFDFTLPQEAMVVDSWLWVEKDIIRAKILDRWTASSIYEGIVNRRQDPSILFKDYSGRYRLLVYPMPMGTTRKVKITFMLPNTWTEKEVRTSIRGDLLRVSRYIPDLQVRVFPSEDWKNPQVQTHPDVAFREFSTPELGKFLVATVPGNYLKPGAGVDFSFDAPWKSGVYISRYGNGEEGYYQLGILPSAILGGQQNLPPQRLMLLLHYNPEKVSGLALKDYLETIRQQAHEALSAGDFFNLMLANLSPQPVSAGWLPVTPENIDRVFDQIQNLSISASHLPTLVGRGMTWIKEQGAGGKILLFANSNAEGDPNIANPLLRELAALSNESDPVPCYIADFQNLNFVNYFVGGVSYRGNGYFYANLARQTRGDYWQQTVCCDGTFRGLVQQTFQSAFSEKAQLDFHTSLSNGFCYNRYFLGGSAPDEADLKQPVFHVGKYKGQWPFVAEFAGSYGGQLFFNAMRLDESALAPVDSTLKTIWNGFYIRNLEETAKSNFSIGEIIATSLRERILSLYTAFLCLEPSLGGEPCPECADQSRGEVTATREARIDSLAAVRITPNPFSEKAFIQLRFQTGKDLSGYRLYIANVLGQEVFAFKELPRGSITELQLSWDGRTQLGGTAPAGMYFFTIQGPTGQAAWPIAFKP